MIRHVILALLRERADHGYRLWARLHGILGPAWRISVAQVYQTLEVLRREGLVEENGDPAGRPPRRPMSITRSGIDELERWLARPPRSSVAPPVRSDFLVRLVVCGPGRERDVLDRVAAERRSYEIERRRIEAERSALDASPGAPAALALEAERLRVDAHLAWLEHCRRALEDQSSIA